MRRVFLLCLEGLSAGAMDTFHKNAQILNRHTIAELLKSDSIVSVIRREFRKLFPDVKIDTFKISDLLMNEILKRDFVEGEKVKEADSRVRRASRKLEKQKTKNSPDLG